MNKFSYIDVESVAEAIPLLSTEVKPFAGGTDQLPLMKDGISKPRALVNLKHAGELRFLREEGDGLHIGALTTLAELDRSDIVRARYTALAEACGQAASPQLRNMATLGGNLLQQARCWYYRGDFQCWLKGGDECQARDGENQFHAIFDQSPCVAVYPSDPPVALIALDASVRIIGPNGDRSVTVAEFLQPPESDRRTMHTLAPDEIVVEVVIPAATGRSVYLKAMDRAAWAYALASVAVTGSVSHGRLSNVRIVLGAVGNVPLRASAAEARVEGQQLSEELLRRAGIAAVEGATALRHNGYKLPLVRNLVIQALRELAA
jgi:xanthine dehydrogenase YagS FAD-binding subunit